MLNVIISSEILHDKQNAPVICLPLAPVVSFFLPRGAIKKPSGVFHYAQRHFQPPHSS